MKRQICIRLVRAVVLVVLEVSPVSLDWAAGAGVPAAPQRGEPPASLSSQDWTTMQELMRAAQYQVTWQVQDGEWAYRAPNRAQGLALAFAVDGFTATRHGTGGESLWEFGLVLSAYGDEVFPSSISRDNLAASGERVEYRWDDHVTEWYENSPAGVEHGLKLEAPPEHGEVAVTLALLGDLAPRLDRAGQALSLLDGEGRAVLQYDSLAVYDATGTELAARLELAEAGEPSPGTNHEVCIAIDAASAIYPLTVDPLIRSQAAILRASDAQAWDRFGRSISLSGDTVVVGAPLENGGAGDPISIAGAVYVFERNHGGADQWGEVAVLRASDAQMGDQFGSSVSLSGDTVVVGAPYEDGGAGDPENSAGAAYVFERNQGGADAWGEVAVLRASDAKASDYFGRSVFLSGDTVVVGADGEDGGAGDPLSGAGAAYVFERNQGGADQWGEVAILRSSEAWPYDTFGSSVSLSGDTAVVGAPYEDGGAGDPKLEAGAAYVFARNQGGADQWGEVAILRVSGAQAGDQFGSSVSVSGDTVVVGAPYEDGGAGDPKLDAGAAYVFERNRGGADQWGRVRALRASDAQASDYFGCSVYLSGDTVVVGAYGEDGGAGDPNPDAGAAYVFQRNQGGADRWRQVRFLRASDAQAGDQFGSSVSISGDTVVVGAYEEDGGPGDPLSSAGAAYISADAAVWEETAVAHASDAQADDFYGQAVSVSGDTIVVGARFESGGPGDPLTGAGAAYVLERNQGGADQWGEVTTLRASDAQPHDNFGRSVSLSGDTVVVGAFHEDGGSGDPREDAGAAYVFERNQGGADQWGQVAILRASAAWAYDYFGQSVAISGDTVVVGAWGQDGDKLTFPPKPQAGAAYVFERNRGGADQWGQVAILRASDTQPDDRFGHSVSVSGDTVVVGAHTEDGGSGDPRTDAGAAYVFERNQGGADRWRQVAILRALDTQSDDRFGISVSISGDTVVAGALWEDGGPGNPLTRAGAAYVFERNRGGCGSVGAGARPARLRRSSR